MPTNDTEPVRTRRSLLDLLLGVGFIGFAASALYPVLRYLKPMASAGPGGPLKLTADEVGKLAKEHSIITRLGTGRVLVFEDAQQNLRALDARCTHEGCTVQYVPGDSVIWCACHNGRYDLDGRVLAGPPPRPLALYGCTRDPDGSVTIQPPKKGES